MPHARHNLRTPRASQLRSQQLLAASIKQQAVYVSASSSNMQCCAACNLKILFHLRSPYSGLFLLLARGTSRNASVLSTSVACTEGTASSTGNTYFSVPPGQQRKKDPAPCLLFWQIKASLGQMAPCPQTHPRLWLVPQTKWDPGSPGDGAAFHCCWASRKRGVWGRQPGRAAALATLGRNGYL